MNRDVSDSPGEYKQFFSFLFVPVASSTIDFSRLPSSLLTFPASGLNAFFFACDQNFVGKTKVNC